MLGTLGELGKLLGRGTLQDLTLFETSAVGPPRYNASCRVVGIIVVNSSVCDGGRREEEKNAGNELKKEDL